MTLRPPRPDEIDPLCALTNRAQVHDRIPQVLDPAELAEDFASLTPEDDVRVAELDGVVAGYAHIWFRPSGERLERAHIRGTVEPALRGRGVGRALMGWGIERATEQLRSAADALPKFVRVEAYEQVADAHRLFERVGLTPVRWFEELLRPLTDLPPATVAPEYDVVPLPDGCDDELLAVRNEAFDDHWGSTRWTRSYFDDWMSGYSVRRDLSVATVERSSGEIVGVCFNEHYPHDSDVTGREDGWIAVLGTRAAHRSRGLASAMVHASLHAFVAAGFTHASIGVDAASPTGANMLYRRLGFALQQQHTTYQLQIE